MGAIISAVIKILLRILNSRILNYSPCKYGFIGNVDAFDIQDLRYEIIQRPDLMVSQLIQEAEQFKACSVRRNGLTVLEDGVAREANVWDLHELQQSLNPSNRKP